MPTDDPAPSNDMAELGNDTVILYGNAFVDRITFVSTTFSTLVMCIGKATRDDSEVLVPLVDMRFDGPVDREQGASTPLFSEMMPLENMAYMLEDMSSDLMTICRQLKGSSSGQLKPDPQRMAETKKFLTEAKANLERCLAELPSED